MKVVRWSRSQRLHYRSFPGRCSEDRAAFNRCSRCSGTSDHDSVDEVVTMRGVRTHSSGSGCFGRKCIEDACIALGYGSGLSTTASTTLKMAVVARIPSASVTIATAVNPRGLRSDRMAIPDREASSPPDRIARLERLKAPRHARGVRPLAATPGRVAACSSGSTRLARRGSRSLATIAPQAQPQRESRHINDPSRASRWLADDRSVEPINSPGGLQRTQQPVGPPHPVGAVSIRTPRLLQPRLEYVVRSYRIDRDLPI